MAEANGDGAGDRDEEEAPNPVPDALVHFGDEKFTSKERKAILPELTMSAAGAMKAVCLRIQNGTQSKADGYCLKILDNMMSTTLNTPDTLGVRLKAVGLSAVLKQKGNAKGLHLEDPTKPTPMKLVNPGK